MTTALLLGLLVTLPAQSEDDPEPAPKTGIQTRLVAKKSTYKLDLGGKKKDDYVTAAKAGNIDPPKVQLELVITNYTKETIRIRSTGSTNRLTFKLEGDGAVSSSSKTAVGKVPIQYVVLKPKEKLTIPIEKLAATERVNKDEGPTDKRHYWTEPGEYKLSASLYTLVTTDFNGPNPMSRYQTFEAKPIRLTVEK